MTYGSCVREALKASDILKNYDVSLELIDVQTLMPFDIESTIVHSVKKTNRVIFLDEDVPGGGTAFMMREVLEKQNAYRYLDSKPICITGSAHRTPFGDNGNFHSKPSAINIVETALKMMNESDPESYNQLF